MTAGGGEVVGIRAKLDLWWNGGGGVFMSFDTWVLVRILSSCSVESIRPLSIGTCWGVPEDGASLGVEGAGTSLPATSAYPTGWGVDVEDLKLVGLRRTLWGGVDTCGCWYDGPCGY